LTAQSGELSPFVRLPSCKRRLGWVAYGETIFAAESVACAGDVDGLGLRGAPSACN